MNLLENELVKKYFGNRHESCPPGCNYGHEEKMAYRILAAMQEPIKKGERYLFIQNYEVPGSNSSGYQEILEIESGYDYNIFHPLFLRLPSGFQTPEKEECDHPFKNLVFQTSGILCCLCSKTVKPSCAEKPTPDPVYCCVCGYRGPQENWGTHKCFPDPAEEKIKEIIDDQPMTLNKSVAALRELVALARQHDKGSSKP